MQYFDFLEVGVGIQGLRNWFLDTKVFSNLCYVYLEDTTSFRQLSCVTRRKKERKKKSMSAHWHAMHVHYLLTKLRWYPFFNPHLTTYHTYIGVQNNVVLELGMCTQQPRGYCVQLKSWTSIRFVVKVSQVCMSQKNLEYFSKMIEYSRISQKISKY